MADPSMGSVVTGYAQLVEQYGKLGVRFLTQRQFDDCVRQQINSHKTADGCK